MTKKIPYLCSMEIMLKKFCKKYKLPEKSLFDLLSHMEEVSFSKGELIIRKGDRNSNFYLIKKGIWWFVGSGETAFSSWTYVEGKPSQINIESVNDSIAYCISKVKLETLFSHSLEMANFGRKIFEREILSVYASTLAYGAPPEISGFILVYYPTIIKSDTCRAKKKRLNENIKNYNKNYADLYS